MPALEDGRSGTLCLLDCFVRMLAAIADILFASVESIHLSTPQIPWFVVVCTSSANLEDLNLQF